MPDELIIAGLVPAAGASQRMGRDKRLLPYQGHTVLETTVDALRQGGARPVVVVLEPHSPCENLPGLADALTALNPRPERGMLSSIRQGLAAVPEEAVAAALLPGDHPFVPPAAVSALIRRFCELRPLLLAPRYPDRRGHPLIIARELFAEAAACDDTVGLRQLVRQRRRDLVEVPLDLPGADDDLDVPGDLSRLDP